jgi:hypothetical protein
MTNSEISLGMVVSNVSDGVNVSNPGVVTMFVDVCVMDFV